MVRSAGKINPRQSSEDRVRHNKCIQSKLSSSARDRRVKTIITRTAFIDSVTSQLQFMSAVSRREAFVLEVSYLDD